MIFKKAVLWSGQGNEYSGAVFPIRTHQTVLKLGGRCELLPQPLCVFPGLWCPLVTVTSRERWVAILCIVSGHFPHASCQLKKLQPCGEFCAIHAPCPTLLNCPSHEARSDSRIFWRCSDHFHYETKWLFPDHIAIIDWHSSLINILTRYPALAKTVTAALRHVSGVSAAFS